MTDLDQLRVLIRDTRTLDDDPESVPNALANAVEALLPQLQPWLTPEQAAERLQVAVRWIERAVEAGDLTEYKRGRQRRYRPADVDALLVPNQ